MLTRPIKLLALASALSAGAVCQSQAYPVTINATTFTVALPDATMQVRWGWRGGGWGWRGGGRGWRGGWGWRGPSAVIGGLAVGGLLAAPYYGGYAYPSYDYGYGYRFGYWYGPCVTFESGGRVKPCDTF